MRCRAMPPERSKSRPYARFSVRRTLSTPPKPSPRNLFHHPPRYPLSISNQEKVLVMNNKKLSLLRSHLISVAAATALVALTAQGALAQKKYDTGASDTEIKIGNVEAYSGPASAYGIIGKTEDAYFKMINDARGINGRKIDFVSYDSGYSPPK